MKSKLILIFILLFSWNLQANSVRFLQGLARIMENSIRAPKTVYHALRTNTHLEKVHGITRLGNTYKISTQLQKSRHREVSLTFEPRKTVELTISQRIDVANKMDEFLQSNSIQVAELIFPQDRSLTLRLVLSESEDVGNIARAINQALEIADESLESILLFPY